MSGNIPYKSEDDYDVEFKETMQNWFDILLFTFLTAKSFGKVKCMIFGGIQKILIINFERLIFISWLSFNKNQLNDIRHEKN